MDNIIRIEYSDLKENIFEVLISLKVRKHDSELLSKILADSSLDGIQSHGVNRLHRLAKYISDGHVKVDEEISLVNSLGTIQQYDGHLGLGIKNAYQCTLKSIDLAKEHSVGIVTLKNTNHWHRAGSYGWLAANKGYILLCWTNTMPNLPPYSSNSNLIGNNPFVVAIPRSNNEHIVLDMSISQYSYGKIAEYVRQDKLLPTLGGYDENGILTNDAKIIMEKGRHLPIGFWKGSVLSFTLDILASSLSGGLTTHEIGKFDGVEKGLSQIFIAINPASFANSDFQQKLIDETIDNFNNLNISEGSSIQYPGQMTLKRRKENLKYGIPIEREIWNKVLELSSSTRKYK